MGNRIPAGFKLGSTGLGNKTVEGRSALTLLLGAGKKKPSPTPFVK